MVNFRGGIHPWYFKELSEEKEVVEAKLPSKVYIPMAQHIGKPAKVKVKVGDSVKSGQLIGEADGFISANVHASVSGKVVGVEDYPHPLGGKVKTVIIETAEKQIEAHQKPANLDKITERIKDAGIVGMGGATFPTYVKYTIPKGKKAEFIVLNGAECEPYLTADHRLMVEHPKEIIEGLRFMMKAAKVKKAYIGIEDNKEDAIESLEKHAVKGIEVVGLHTKYPQGGEKMLVYALTGKKVPTGGLPLDVGAIVNNVGTAYAVYEAVALGKPLIKRIVTVTGDVKEPKNIMAYVGTPFKELIEMCDGYRGEPGKVLMGGPMMGLAQSTDEVPVLKGTSGILVRSKENLKEEEEGNCIRCAKCVDACPMNLMPNLIALYAKKGNYEKSESIHLNDCIECGCCAYMCPSKIPLVQYIKLAKAKLKEKKK